LASTTTRIFFQNLRRDSKRANAEQSEEKRYARQGARGGYAASSVSEVTESQPLRFSQI